MKGGRKIDKMGQILLKTTIVRETGKLYYCSTSKDGFITVCSSIMNRGGRKKDKVVKKATKPVAKKRKK